MQADLVFEHAHVVPVSRPPIPDGAVAVHGDRILAVGTAADVEPTIGPGTRRIHCGGHSLLPGFIDSHQHPLFQVDYKAGVSLWDARSIPEVLQRLAAAARRTAPGEWVFSATMQEQYVDRYPTRAELDAAAPHHPLLVTSSSSHVGFANSRALAAAGIAAATPDPQGGKFGRTPDGELDGIIYEKALEPLRAALPQRTAEQAAAGLLDIAADNTRLGITSVHEAWLVRPEDLAGYQLAVERGFPLRTCLMVDHARPGALWSQLAAAGLRTGFGSDRLRLGPAKIFLDGDTGPATAYMSAPYVHQPDSVGFPNYPQEELDAMVEQAHRAGWQVAIHAIGDRGAEMVIDSYARALRLVPRPDHRLRLEHGVTLRPDLIRRMADLGIHCGFQSVFIWDYAGSERELLGPEREPWLYALRSMLAAGVTVSDSSDFPVVQDHSPLLGIWAAVTRQTATGRRVGAAEAIGVAEALRLYTLNGAYAAFEEGIKGSLEPGKLADLALLSGDLLRVEPEAIRTLQVDMTVIGGQEVFVRQS